MAGMPFSFVFQDVPLESLLRPSVLICLLLSFTVCLLIPCPALCENLQWITSCEQGLLDMSCQWRHDNGITMGGLLCPMLLTPESYLRDRASQELSLSLWEWLTLLNSNLRAPQSGDGLSPTNLETLCLLASQRGLSLELHFGISDLFCSKPGSYQQLMDVLIGNNCLFMALLINMESVCPRSP